MDATLEKQIRETEIKIIKSKYWKLPEHQIEGWRPYTAFIDYRCFIGPDVRGKEHGISLKKDLMFGITGPRGSGKDETMSFLLMKMMRAGRTVWTNYPISFFVIEADGHLSYYESRPLNFEDFYAFAPYLRHGAVGITELQYYVEARTSGRSQNRMASYNIMMIRKTANSFTYNVQDPSWVDKRFGWSNDIDIECRDIAKQNYEKESVLWVPPFCLDEYGDLKNGAIIYWNIKDTSGIMTGVPYRKSKIEYEDFQFDAFAIWDAYPSNFLVDVREAINSYKEPDKKKDEKANIEIALEMAIDYFHNNGCDDVLNTDLWLKSAELGKIDFDKRTIQIAGGLLSKYGIPKKQKSNGKYYYNIAVVFEKNGDIK